MKRLTQYTLKYYLSVLLLIFFLPVNPSADAEKQKVKPEITRRIYFGGMFGLQFGTITDIQVSPLAGYRITPRFSTGVGLKYEYYSERNPLFRYSTHIFGPRLFSRYLFLASFSNILPTKYNGGLFFEGEYEALNMDDKYFGYSTPGEGKRFWLKSWLAGIGLRQPLSYRSALNIILLYNLRDTEYTPYTNPMFRIEVSF